MVSHESSPLEIVTWAALDDGQPSEGRASVRFRTPGITVSVRLRSTATRPTLNVRCAPAVILPRMFRVTISVVRSYLAVTLTLADVAFTYSPQTSAQQSGTCNFGKYHAIVSPCRRSAPSIRTDRSATTLSPGRPTSLLSSCCPSSSSTHVTAACDATRIGRPTFTPRNAKVPKSSSVDNVMPCLNRGSTPVDGAFRFVMFT